jgi:hypothetical protein
VSEKTMRRSASAELASSVKAGSASSEHRTARNRSRNGLLRPWAAAAYAANVARGGHDPIARSN